MVFRELVTAAEAMQARRLLGAGTHRCPDEVWSGLFDLTADAGSVVAGVAATRQISPRVVEIRAVVTGGEDRTYGRLLRELADVCRARGVEWLVAGADRVGADLLREAGFSVAYGDGWLALQL